LAQPRSEHRQRRQPALPGKLAPHLQQPLVFLFHAGSPHGFLLSGGFADG